MSADNQMVVERHGEKCWCAYMQIGDKPYDTEQRKNSSFYRIFDTRNAAIDYAADVCASEIVEYGMRVQRDTESGD